MGGRHGSHMHFADIRKVVDSLSRFAQQTEVRNPGVVLRRSAKQVE